MTRSLALMLPLALVACATPSGTELLLPDQVPVVWEAEYNGLGDGLGAVVPVDVMAYDAATGEPLAGVDVQIWTADASAMPVRLDGVSILDNGPGEAVSPPTAGASVDLGGDEPFVGQPGLAVSVPDAGLDADHTTELWDALHDEFVAVEPTDDLELTTDAGGVARLYLVVDAFPPADLPVSGVVAAHAGPGDHPALAPIEVTASTDQAEAQFSLVPR